PMQPRGDEDRDLLTRDAGGFERAEHLREDQLVWHRPGDVTDHDARVAPPAGELGQRRRADGPLDRLANRRLGVRDRPGILIGQGPHEALFRQVHHQTGSAVFEFETHRGYRTSLSDLNNVKEKRRRPKRGAARVTLVAGSSWWRAFYAVRARRPRCSCRTK